MMRIYLPMRSAWLCVQACTSGQLRCILGKTGKLNAPSVASVTFTIVHKVTTTLREANLSRQDDMSWTFGGAQGCSPHQTLLISAPSSPQTLTLEPYMRQ
eukprot:1609987-Amphidinium_carterae.1